MEHNHMPERRAHLRVVGQESAPVPLDDYRLYVPGMQAAEQVDDRPPRGHRISGLVQAVVDMKARFSGERVDTSPEASKGRANLQLVVTRLAMDSSGLNRPPQDPVPPTAA